MQIIQIVSRLPPAVDGVGDYACLLAKQLRANHGIHTVFVVCDPAWGKTESKVSNDSSTPQPPSARSWPGIAEMQNRKLEMEAPSTTLDGFMVYQLKRQSAEELLRVLSQPGMPATILLQYVGYGYQKRGCPAWLARGLRAWKNGGQKAAGRSEKPDAILDSERRLLTMFHELFATGPFWSSVFWTSPVQRWVAKSLALLNDQCFTNLNLHARVLENFFPEKKTDVTVLPVFSNVGEPEHLAGWNERQPKMIVFGSAGWRRNVYSEHKSELEKACRTMGLDEIVDIGAPVEIPQRSVRVSKRGVLSSAEVSQEMSGARAGFFTCPAHCLGKSGIFAAYAAHGLVPVTFGENRMDNLDGLALGKHFTSANMLQGYDASHLENIGRIAYEWYAGHSRPRQAAAFAEKIPGCSSE
jgi:hypothetical protein